MNTRLKRSLLLTLGLFAVYTAARPSEDAAMAQSNELSSLPAHDLRAEIPPRNVDTPRDFPAFKTLDEWQKRRAFIRQQVLVSCGLYPLPSKTPLHTHVFDRVVRDGYTIEKVYFQTYPGFYLAGNLYRPYPEHAGERHPGILVAHGHWAEGRMANQELGSIPARAITFARMGAVAFTYDMVGYNDTRQIDHKFANDREHWLWGVSLMGLQTWNSIRALDFIGSLKDVDTKRLAITGESGGGTQTMILGAVDDRLAAVAPCVMVSHTMQGGCLCENAPGLRIDFSNMEVAAIPAPRPQMMVAASGDWTKTMMTVEGPAVKSVYQLFGQPEHLDYVRFNYPHNINKDSREAVDQFFGQWLLHQPDAKNYHEPPYTMEPVESLRVFPDGKPLPAGAKDAAALTRDLVHLAQTQVDAMKPHDIASLDKFSTTFYPAWQHTLALQLPEANQIVAVEQPVVDAGGYHLTRLNLGRRGLGDNIPAALFSPAEPEGQGAAVIADPGGRAALMDITTGAPGPLVKSLLQKGQSVLLLDAFLTGERADSKVEAARKPFENYFTTYNRTDLQERVQDLVTACAYIRSRPGVQPVVLIGQGQAGLWALLAAPAADAVAADCAQTDLRKDDALLSDSLFVPGLRKMGDFRTAAVLMGIKPLLLHNTGENFTAAGWISDVYHSLHAAGSFHLLKEMEEPDDLVDFAVRELQRRPEM